MRRRRKPAPPHGASARHARVYWQLRSAHLERAHALPPATVFYRSRSYDFDTALLEGLDTAQVGYAGLARKLLRRRFDVVEVNEPLMRSGIEFTALGVLSFRLRGLLDRRPGTVVTYAIENLDPYRPRADLSTKNEVRRSAERMMSWWLARRIDRLAFGTRAAEQVYRRRLNGRLTARTTVIEALSAPCDCLASVDRNDGDAGALTDRGQTVLFLGALDERKGFAAVAAAWPSVVAACAGATLTVAGKGPLQTAATALADAYSSVRVVLDPPRTDVHRLLRSHAVLVLLSQRTRNWREQVGLPIVEALAHGMTVVASDETGLAAWLREHGHAVLPASTSSEEVAAAVVGALAARRPPSAVLADLPNEDSRLTADRWLFEGADR